MPEGKLRPGRPLRIDHECDGKRDGECDGESQMRWRMQGKCDGESNGECNEWTNLEFRIWVQFELPRNPATPHGVEKIKKFCAKDSDAFCIR